MTFLKYLLFGVLMGIANVIPGVSGGTMAVVLNFYDLLMESITLNFKTIRKNLYFIIPLGLGLVIGVVGLSKLMKILFTHYPTQTFSAFIGIVLGSLPLIYFKAKEQEDIKPISWIACILSIGVLVALALLPSGSMGNTIRYTSLNLESFVMCFISMCIAVATMIIPGISGSLILLILGMYGTIYTVVIGSLNIPLLIPSFFGGLLGLFGGAKLIKTLFDKHRQLTYMIVLGLLCGSLMELFENTNIFNQTTLTIFTSLISLIVMFGIVLMFSISEMRKK